MDDDPGEATANARLFAAAPDLLEACEEARKYIGKAAGATGIGALLEAAIAKATT